MGGYATPDSYPTLAPTLAIFSTDMNNDGIDDLLVISSTNPWIPPSQEEVWLGHPGGRLTKASAGSMGAITKTTGAADVVVTDLTGDG